MIKMTMTMNETSEGSRTRLTRRYQNQQQRERQTNDSNGAASNNNSNNKHGSPTMTAAGAAATSTSRATPFLSPQRVKSHTVLLPSTATPGGMQVPKISLDAVGSSSNCNENGYKHNRNPQRDRAGKQKQPQQQLTFILVLLCLVAVVAAAGAGGVAYALFLWRRNSNHSGNSITNSNSNSDNRNEPSADTKLQELRQLTAELERKLDTDEQLLVQSLQSQLAAAVSEKTALQRQLTDLQQQQQQQQSNNQNNNNNNPNTNTAQLRGGNNQPQLQLQLELLQRELELLHAQGQEFRLNLQALARRRVLEQWGPGPHQVRIALLLSPSLSRFGTRTSGAEKKEGTAAKDEDEQATIVLELAPIDEMPYTVWWFLEQVTRGLFTASGAKVHRNLPHIVQVDVADRSVFESEGLASVLFQEYSDQFPHAKYTVGYAGRPGGPNFYINVEDNRALHGPGGQDGKKGQENSPRGEADPCFARVVDGFAVVDRLHRLPVTDQSDGFVLEDRVTVADLQLLMVPANGNAADADANAKE